MSAFNTSSPPSPLVRKSAFFEGVELPPTFRIRKEMAAPLKVLKELCDYPVLYMNYRVINNEGAIAVTISDKNPTTDNKEMTAKYPGDAIVVDLCLFNDTSEKYIHTIDYWANMLCSVLTFRGHEVFLNGHLYVPYE